MNRFHVVLAGLAALVVGVLVYVLIRFSRSGKMRPEHFYGLLAATVAAHIVIANSGPRPVVTGQLQASTRHIQHFLQSNSGDLRFDTANVAALRHNSPDGASAISLQDQHGNELGAVGYKNEGGNPTYLNGAVFLAGGRIDPKGTRPEGGPTPVVLGGEGWFGNQYFTTARLHLKNDWSISWNNHAGIAHTSVTDAGEWRFTQPLTIPALHFTSGPQPRVGNISLKGEYTEVENKSVTERTFVLLTRRTTGGAITSPPLVYATQPGKGFTVISFDSADHGDVTYLLIDAAP